MLREVAEYPNSFGPLGPRAERIETARYTLCMGAGLGWTTGQRQRFAAAEVDEALAEVRALLRERGRTKTQWEEHGLLLHGGATLPEARGRGAYRALLRARWDEAVARGTPALITQGGSMSRPILERAGFRRVGHIHMLVDDFGWR
ncbi:MAG TPA: hypothetical protein VFU10_05190 [Gaiellaceae bacterium]|nr:hypothetical protein [Gaiellaceae bacterium]